MGQREKISILLKKFSIFRKREEGVMDTKIQR